MVALPSTSSPSGSGRYSTSVWPRRHAAQRRAQPHRKLIADQFRYRVDGLAVCAHLHRALDGSAGAVPAVKHRLVTGQLPCTSRSAAEPTCTVPLSASIAVT